MIETTGTPVRSVERTFMLDDLTVRSDGSGRIVEAYAAVFNKRSEIHDQDGHYWEENDPSSFTKTINDKGPGGFTVLFNHGRTIDGTPNPVATMPIGHPLEVRSDERGVFTATRYLDNPLADQVLNAIKAGALKAQSYSGRFMRSAKGYPAGKGRGELPLIRRMEIEMREYGPAVFAAFTQAEILGTRSADVFVRSLLATPPDQRLHWLEQFELATTLEATPEPLTPGTLDGAADQTGEPQPHSDRSATAFRDRIRRERIRRNM